MNDKIIVLDAFSLIYKAFYGVRPMSSSKGIPTNAVYGFMNMLLKLIREEEPKYIFAAFDTSKDTFRARMYPGYKADRQKMPEDLAAQIPYIIDLLKSANIMFLACDGYEADDIIGFLSALGDKHNDETLIVTGDRDSFQLASSRTTVLYSKRGISDTIRADEDYIRSTYGIEPAQLTDVKSLMGDQSDRIPGVSGVGEKTALSLIQKYGTLDNVYQNIDEQKGKLKEKLTEGRESAYLSRDLAGIKRDIPLDFRYEEADDTDFKIGRAHV